MRKFLIMLLFLSGCGKTGLVVDGSKIETINPAPIPTVVIQPTPYEPTYCYPDPTCESGKDCVNGMCEGTLEQYCKFMKNVPKSCEQFKPIGI